MKVFTKLWQHKYLWENFGSEHVKLAFWGKIRYNDDFSKYSPTWTTYHKKLSLICSLCHKKHVCQIVCKSDVHNSSFSNFFPKVMILRIGHFCKISHKLPIIPQQIRKKDHKSYRKFIFDSVIWYLLFNNKTFYLPKTYCYFDWFLSKISSQKQRNK